MKTYTFFYSHSFGKSKREFEADSFRQARNMFFEYAANCNGDRRLDMVTCEGEIVYKKEA